MVMSKFIVTILLFSCWFSVTSTLTTCTTQTSCSIVCGSQIFDLTTAVLADDRATMRYFVNSFNTDGNQYSTVIPLCGSYPTFTSYPDFTISDAWQLNYPGYPDKVSLLGKYNSSSWKFGSYSKDTTTTAFVVSYLNEHDLTTTTVYLICNTYFDASSPLFTWDKSYTPNAHYSFYISMNQACMHASPTARPSQSPTTRPSTLTPTLSQSPTILPSKQPSVQPTVSLSPTLQPSTLIPTVQPSTARPSHVGERSCTVYKGCSIKCGGTPYNLSPITLNSFDLPAMRLFQEDAISFVVPICGVYPTSIGLSNFTDAIQISTDGIHHNLGVYDSTSWLASPSSGYLEVTLRNGENCSEEADGQPAKKEIQLQFVCNLNGVANYPQLSLTVIQSPCRYIMEIQMLEVCTVFNQHPTVVTPTTSSSEHSTGFNYTALYASVAVLGALLLCFLYLLYAFRAFREYICYSAKNRTTTFSINTVCPSPDSYSLLPRIVVNSNGAVPISQYRGSVHPLQMLSAQAQYTSNTNLNSNNSSSNNLNNYQQATAIDNHSGRSITRLPCAELVSSDEVRGVEAVWAVEEVD